MDLEAIAAQLNLHGVPVKAMGPQDFTGYEYVFSSLGLDRLYAIDRFIERSMKVDAYVQNIYAKFYFDIPKRVLDCFYTMCMPMEWLRTYTIYAELGNSTHYHNLEELCKAYNQRCEEAHRPPVSARNLYLTYEENIQLSLKDFGHMAMSSYMVLWSMLETDMRELARYYMGYKIKKYQSGKFVSASEVIDQLYSKRNIFLHLYRRDKEHDKRALHYGVELRNTFHDNGIASKDSKYYMPEYGIKLEKDKGWEGVIDYTVLDNLLRLAYDFVDIYQEMVVAAFRYELQDADLETI